MSSDRTDSSQERRRSFLIAVLVLLVCLVGVGVYAWWMLRDSDMSAIGTIVLGAGIVVTLGLGIGLMSLVYYSNRKGFDNSAGGGN
jgi:membrane protein YdbS with pleckstrin-like domain